MLTPSIVKTYCALLLLGNFMLFGFQLRRDLRFAGDTDFLAFYSAGQIFNNSRSRLYDQELQKKTYELRTGDTGHALPYAYAPWFVLPFSLLAKLSFIPAFLLWVLVSVALVMGGYFLVWKVSDFPPQWKLPGLLVALAFPPFQIFTIRGGQVAAVGFFVLALTFYLHRREQKLVAGLVFALMLYKPTLLLLLLPMMVITRQWRLLIGFAVGAITLSLLSLLLVGVEGLRGYVHILQTFYAASNSPSSIFPMWYYIDLGAAIRLLTGRSIGALRIVFLAGTVPLLWLAWRRLSLVPASWALAVVGTLLFGVYTPLYDATLLILVVMWARPERIGSPLLLTLFLLPAFSKTIAGLTHVQVMTLALGWLSWKLYRSCDTLCDTNLNRSAGTAEGAR